MKGLLISAPGSGAGKTTVSAALMAALLRRGMRVQPFKCGPDFIDPGHHQRICRRPSHNLDTWMLSGETNRRIFSSACQDADIAVVEGMMGLFDGIHGSDDAGSSAEIARLLGLPVLLVVDASAAARSIAAVVHGFQHFDPAIQLAGVMLNQVAGEPHARMLVEALRSSNPSLPVGWLAHRPELKLKERYLGLQTADERSWSESEIESLAALIEPASVIDEILPQCSIDIIADLPESQPADAATMRIGIARDRAFSFYYEAGLDELRRQGAELVEFSPLNSHHLPENLQGLYFGGGYPELYAQALSENHRFLHDVREFAASGKPIYGECGGLIFLSRMLQTRDGQVWPMTGLLPLAVEMTDRLVHFGYVDVQFTGNTLAPAGTWLRGHSFHCSRVLEVGPVGKQTLVHYSISGEKQAEGFTSGNVFGSYIHLHFAANPALAAGFIALARQCQEPQVVQ